MREQIDKDIKTAMLAGDKTKAETLRGLKNALQYEAVSLRVKPDELTDEQMQKVLAREAKKRQEAAELYTKGGSPERASAELAERVIIDGYLPEPASEADTEVAVKEEIAKVDNPTPADLGRIIGSVRGRLGPAADGATIARLVKEALSQ
jgi:uncharacterized protein YqeY